MNKIIFFSLLAISILSCSKKEFSPDHLISDKIPGKWFGKIACDSKGDQWFVTSEVDNTVQMPSYSSYLPIRTYLTRYSGNSYEVYDDRFMGAKEIITDNADRLWFISSNKLYLINNGKYIEEYKLADATSYFEWIIKDQDANIWVGGYNAPLLRISTDPEIKISNMSNNASASNSSAACFDRNNNLWVVLSNHEIGMMDPQGFWHVYTPDNSALPYQSFWSITSDKDNIIWVGCGFPDTSTNLMKFDGTNWQKVTIKDDKGNSVYGTVRQLYSDNNKIWIVTEFSKNSAFDYDYLITFDGISWNRIYSVPSDDGISDISFDLTSGKALIGTLNKGLFSVDMN